MASGSDSFKFALFLDSSLFENCASIANCKQCVAYRLDGFHPSIQASSGHLGSGGDGTDDLGAPIYARQKLLREQGTVEVLVDMLKCPFALWGGRWQLEELHHVQSHHHGGDPHHKAAASSIRGSQHRVGSRVAGDHHFRRRSSSHAAATPHADAHHNQSSPTHARHNPMTMTHRSMLMTQRVWPRTLLLWIRALVHSQPHL